MYNPAQDCLDFFFFTSKRVVASNFRCGSNSHRHTLHHLTDVAKARICTACRIGTSHFSYLEVKVHVEEEIVYYCLVDQCIMVIINQ